MDNHGFRAIIYHLASQGKTAKVIHTELTSQYGQDAPSLSTVKNWRNERKWGRTDLANRPGSGRPPEAITASKIDQAKKLVAADKTISMRSLARELRLHRNTVEILMRDHLGSKRMGANWIPYRLFDNQKAA